MGRAVFVLITLLLIIGCNSESPEKGDSLSSLLPIKIDQTDYKRIGEIRSFVGDSLWEYINGGAEVYHTYGFEKVITADYTFRGSDIVLDIYKFASADQAYGMYSYLRPDEPVVESYGVEGFRTSNSVDFAIGDLLVRITAYEESEQFTLILSKVAEALAISLPGTKSAPHLFEMFPDSLALPFTDKIIAESFMGRSFLKDIYTRSYVVNQDTLVLLLSEDKSKEKFHAWKLAASSRSELSSEFSFDEGYGMLLQDDYYGVILSGLKSGYLAGVIGYSDQESKFVSDWLITIR